MKNNEISNLLDIKNDKNLTQTEKDIIVGTILGDGHIRKVKNSHSLTLSYGSNNKTYAEFIFQKLKRLSNYSMPKLSKSLDLRYNKERLAYSFGLLVNPSLIPFGNLFLKPYEKKGKISYMKILPSFEILFDLISPQALAYWIMDDGQEVKRGGITLCTDNFSYEEVLLLKSVLEKKYNFTCTIHKKINKFKTKFYFRIYIWNKDLPLLNSLIKDYMCPSMLYKIHYEIKPKIPLSLTKKNIKSREERLRLRLWKEEYGNNSIPPKKIKNFSMSPRAIKAREKRAQLKIKSIIPHIFIF